MKGVCLETLKFIRVNRVLGGISLALNLLLGGALISLYATSDPVVAKVENSIGNKRVVRASQVRRELAKRHGEDVLGDLAGRRIVTLAADESKILLDAEEVEARWFLWSQEPGVKANLDAGETTEAELRERLTTLVLLDQLTLNELNPGERENVLRRFYETNKRDLEEIKLRHILLQSQKEADDVAQRLAAGVDFAELAKRFSLDPLTREQGGNLGWKSREDLQADLSPLLFLIPEGRASKPISSRHGWHLFLVEDKRTEFAEVKDTARRQWCELRRPDTLANLRKRFNVESPDKKELVEKLRPIFDSQESQPLGLSK